MNHVNIIKIYDVGLIGKYPYIKMECFEGTTLTKYLSENGVLEPFAARNLIKKVLRGLIHAHKEARIVHRDLKPSNVMLAKGKTAVKIVDFGLGVCIEHDIFSRITKTGEHAIGGHYSAPELVQKQRLIDCRTDLYSVSAIWYTALTGRAPAGSSIDKLLLDQKVPNEGMKVLLKGLEPIESRYSEASEMLSAIESIEKISISSNSIQNPIKTTYGVKSDILPPEERAFLIALANESIDGTGLWSLNQKMEKAGHTALACNIAYLNLTRQNYLITSNDSDLNGNEYKTISISHHGWEWLHQNRANLTLKTANI